MRKETQNKLEASENWNFLKIEMIKLLLSK